MKKVICCVVSIVFLFSLCSCESDVKASPRAVSIATSAIEAADAYLDNDINATLAKARIDELYSQMDYLDNDKDSDTYVYDIGIATSIISLSSSVMHDSFEPSSSSYNKIVEARNTLAKKVNVKERKK